MWYKWEIIEKLNDANIGDRFTYIDVINWNESWRLKSYNNDTKTAFIVFKCDNNWNNNWLNYTAQWCSYDRIIRG